MVWRLLLRLIILPTLKSVLMARLISSLLLRLLKIPLLRQFMLQTCLKELYTPLLIR